MIASITRIADGRIERRHEGIPERPVRAEDVGSRIVALRTWAQAIARRRGKKFAVVALARRLARILFAMWRDEAEYQPDRIREKQTKPAAIGAERQPAAAVSRI